MAAQQERDTKFTAETLVPVGLACTVIAAVAGAAMWLQGTLSALGGKLDLVQRDITTMTQRIDGTWTRNDMDNYVRMMRVLNPTMKFPETVGR